MSGDTFSKFIAELTQKQIFDLVKVSSEMHEKIGGIMAIEELIDVPCGDNVTMTIRFANYLRMIFQQQAVEPATLVRASMALGQ